MSKSFLTFDPPDPSLLVGGPGEVLLWTNDPRLTVKARVGEGTPTLDPGVGGWTSQAIPRRPPIAVFEGSPARTVALELLLDGWLDGRDVTRDYRNLERMGRPIGHGKSEPPLVGVNAPGLLMPYGVAWWTIGALSPAEQLLDATGTRLRVKVSVTLTEYLEGARLAPLALARNKSTKARKRSSKIVHKGYDGETLREIAKRCLGNGDRWRELAKLNGIRDSWAVKAGQTIRLP